MKRDAQQRLHNAASVRHRRSRLSEESLEITSTQSTDRAKYAQGCLSRVIPFTYISKRFAN